MKIDQKHVSLGAGILGLAVAAGITTAYAQQEPVQEVAPPQEVVQFVHNVDGPPEEMKAHHEEIEAAIENNDYNAWAQAMRTQHEKMQQQMNEQFEQMITEEHFADMQELQALEESSDVKAYHEKQQEMAENGGMRHFGAMGSGGPKGAMGHGAVHFFEEQAQTDELSTQQQ